MAASLNVSGAGKYVQTGWDDGVAVATVNVLLRSVIVANKDTNPFYVHLYDTATNAAGAVQAAIAFEVAANTAGGISFDVPHRFRAGLLISCLDDWDGTGIADTDAKITVHFEIGPVSQ